VLTEITAVITIARTSSGVRAVSTAISGPLISGVKKVASKTATKTTGQGRHLVLNGLAVQRASGDEPPLSSSWFAPERGYRRSSSEPYASAYTFVRRSTFRTYSRVAGSRIPSPSARQWSTVPWPA
jgi:hypothetical protein